MNNVTNVRESISRPPKCHAMTSLVWNNYDRTFLGSHRPLKDWAHIGALFPSNLGDTQQICIMVRVKGEIFLGLCWVYGKRSFQISPVRSLNIYIERENWFRFHLQRWIGLMARPNSNAAPKLVDNRFHWKQIEWCWDKKTKDLSDRLHTKSFVLYESFFFSATLMAIL